MSGLTAGVFHFPPTLRALGPRDAMLVAFALISVNRTFLILNEPARSKQPHHADLNLYSIATSRTLGTESNLPKSDISDIFFA
jgi:hypothetical protein